jgi:HIRAN domain
LRWVLLTAVVLWLLDSVPSMGAEAVVEILVQSSLTAGLSHHEAKAVWDQLRIGDPLTLVRESDNPNDINAVRVDWSGHTLGYIPRADNEAIARQLDRGNKLEARISRLGQYRNHRRKLEVQVYLRM